MDQDNKGWATLDTEAEEVAVRYRPFFRQIRDGAVEREFNRILPHREIVLLKEAGFGAVRIPKELGGRGISRPALFNLFIELSDADSNVAQALRPHFGFCEDVVNSRSSAYRERWCRRLVEGGIVGSAWTEIGDAKLDRFSTRIVRDKDNIQLTGKKFYATGSIFANWIDVGASDENGDTVSAVVSKTAEGVTLLDDWDGFGQRLTASGTALFSETPVDALDVVPGTARFKYSSAFYQLVHLATLAGIGRAAAREIAEALANRKRIFSLANGTQPCGDPQLLQIVGRVRSAAYCAGAVVLQAAQSLQRVFQLDPEAAISTEDALLQIAEIEVSQAQAVIPGLILEATASMFDVLGASATLRSKALDRHWRNARAISSHNPHVYKERIIGDYAVNKTPLPLTWRIGQA